jgi:hypothetical protein
VKPASSANSTKEIKKGINHALLQKSLTEFLSHCKIGQKGKEGSNLERRLV